MTDEEMRKAAIARSVKFGKKQKEKIRTRSKSLKLVTPPDCKVIFEYFSLDEGPDSKFVRKQIFEDGTYISTQGVKGDSENDLLPLTQRCFYLKRAFANHIKREIDSHAEFLKSCPKYLEVPFFDGCRQELQIGEYKFTGWTFIRLFQEDLSPMLGSWDDKEKEVLYRNSYELTLICKKILKKISRFTKYNRIDDWFVYKIEKSNIDCNECCNAESDDQTRLNNKDPLLVLAADRWTDFHHLEVFKDFMFITPDRYILACDGKRLEADVSLVSLMAHGDFLLQYEEFGSFEMMEKDFIKTTFAMHGEDWEKKNNLDIPDKLNNNW
ncbi:MAG: hypothetical protein KBT11_10545 [Treponema sp.]|nr:hypothetical protein [Candidatus Treponema equifaecale]